MSGLDNIERLRNCFDCGCTLRIGDDGPQVEGQDWYRNSEHIYRARYYDFDKGTSISEMITIICKDKRQKEPRGYNKDE